MFFHATHTFVQHLHTFLQNISEITIAKVDGKSSKKLIDLLILRYLLKQSLDLLRISRPSRAFSQHLLLKVLLRNYRWFISCNKFNIYFFSNPNGGILSILVKRKINRLNQTHWYHYLQLMQKTTQPLALYC